MTTTVANILIGAICLSVCVTQSGICVAQTSTQDSSSYPKRRYGADLVDCDNVTKIVFVSFFPCLRTDCDTDFKASEKLGECDLLAEAAAYLAVDRVNQDPDILTNITLELYPIYIPAISESVTVSELNIVCYGNFSFEGDYFHGLVEKWDFAEKGFADCLLVPPTVHRAFEPLRKIFL